MRLKVRILALASVLLATTTVPAHAVIIVVPDGYIFLADTGQPTVFNDSLIYSAPNRT